MNNMTQELDTLYKDKAYIEDKLEMKIEEFNKLSIEQIEDVIYKCFIILGYLSFEDSSCSTYYRYNESNPELSYFDIYAAIEDSEYYMYFKLLAKGTSSINYNANIFSVISLLRDDRLIDCKLYSSDELINKLNI